MAFLFVKSSNPTLALCNEKLQQDVPGIRILNDNNILSALFGHNKFSSEKVLKDGLNYTIVFDGIILNQNELHRYGDDNFSILKGLYEKYGDCFVKVLRGSFSGLLYDKRADKYLFFSDHINSKPLYRWIGNDSVIFSSDMATLVRTMKLLKISVRVDLKGAYSLLTYGFTLENNTLVSDVLKVNTGHVGVLKNNNYFENCFYNLSNQPQKSYGEEEAIEQIDYLFKSAVTKAFNKDLEHGYKHVSTLSGGLDSRMTVMVANDMGFQNQLNLTFSQSDYLDETIAKRISADLKHDWIFKSLDNGNFLYDIMEVVPFTGGNVLFYGLAHGYSLLKNINFERYGLFHTGQLGDVVLSSFKVPRFEDKNYVHRGLGAYNTVLLERLKNFDFANIYENEEIFLFYERCFNGANRGLAVSQSFTETYSPFYDVDLLDYALTIPSDMRANHSLYKKWMLQKFPKSTSYKWEKTNSYVSAKSWEFAGKALTGQQVLDIGMNKIKEKIGLDSSMGINSKNHMNPLEYWYNTNDILKKFMDSFFEKNIDLINNRKLAEDCRILYHNYNAISKNQVLSLIASIKFLELN